MTLKLACCKLSINMEQLACCVSTSTLTFFLRYRCQQQQPPQIKYKSSASFYFSFFVLIQQETFCFFYLRLLWWSNHQACFLSKNEIKMQHILFKGALHSFSLEEIQIVHLNILRFNEVTKETRKNDFFL